MKIRPLDSKPPLTSVAGEHPCIAVAAPLFAPERADFDAEKVARFAQLIRDGRFTIDAETIADKLLASVGELRGRSLH